MCTVALPRYFVVFGSVSYTCYCVHAVLYELVLFMRHILFKVANHQFIAEQKHPTARDVMICSVAWIVGPRCGT